jgi:hypothetical protein
VRAVRKEVHGAGHVGMGNWNERWEVGLRPYTSLIGKLA